MNMAKLGIVSTAGNSFHSLDKPSKYGACRMTTYTLCEVEARLCRHRNRHSLAFYIPTLLRAGVRPDRSRGQAHVGALNWLAGKVAVLVPLQLILISRSYAYLCGPSKPLQSLLRKACMAFRRNAKLFQLVTPSQVLKTAASLAECGFGGFRLVQLSLGNGATPCEPIKTAVSHAAQTSQRKNWVRTVTEYYSTLDTVTRDYLSPQEWRLS